MKSLFILSYKIWKQIIQPSTAIQKEKDRKKASLLAGILFPLLFLTVIGLIVAENEFEKHALMFLIPLSYASFFLAKTRFFRLAGIIATLGMNLPSYYIVISSGITHPIILSGWLAWNLICILFSSILLTFRTTFLFWSGNIAATLSLPFIIQGLDFKTAFISSQLTIAIGLTIFISSYILNQNISDIDSKNELLEKEIRLHRETSDALRKSENRNTLSHIFAKIDLFELNLKTTDLSFPEQFLDLLGKEFDTGSFKLDEFLSFFHPDDKKGFLEELEKCILTGNNFQYVHRIIQPNGTSHWMEEAGNIVRDDDASEFYLLGVIQDITAKKQVEEELTRAKIIAEKANQSKSDFLSSMSHELRTPLNAIMGFSQLLEMEMDIPKEQIQMIHEIRKAGSHLLDLINEILDLSRIEAGQTRISLEGVRPGPVIDNVMALVEPFATNYNVEIIKPDTENLPIIFADSLRLKQVLFNLLSNGIKYNHKGGKVSIGTEILANNYLRISISDTGNGIPPELQKDLFEPFNRLGKENSEIEGTGIGLTLTRKLVELMKGKIGFISNIGEGTVFWVDLRIFEKSNKSSQQATVKNIASLGSLHKNKMILYIDDNPENARLMEAVFRELPKIKLIHADNAKDGISLAIRHQPDLILMDINLPEMDGYEALTFLRANKETNHIQVVALSASSENDMKKCLEAGFNYYFNKPLDVSRFIEAMNARFL